MSGPDISDRPRTFEVWLCLPVAGHDGFTERVDVPAGEDANEMCAAVLDAMMGNEIDSGWQEADEDEDGDEDGTWPNDRQDLRLTRRGGTAGERTQ